MRVYHGFFWYPDPEQLFLKWIRIRIRNTAFLDPLFEFRNFFNVKTGATSATSEFTSEIYISASLRVYFIDNKWRRMFLYGIV